MVRGHDRANKTPAPLGLCASLCREIATCRELATLGTWLIDSHCRVVAGRNSWRSDSDCRTVVSRQVKSQEERYVASALLGSREVSQGQRRLSISRIGPGDVCLNGNGWTGFHIPESGGYPAAACFLNSSWVSGY